MRSPTAFFHKIAPIAAAFALIGIIAFALASTGVSTAFAQDANLTQFGETTLLGNEDLIIVIARLIRIVLGLIGIIMTVLVIYAGWLYMISRGESAKIEKAKKLLSQTIIGFLIIWFSFSLSWWVLNKLLDSSQQRAGTITAKQYAEPLKGSLGAGIINSHYPPHNAKDVSRNTGIFVEFKEAINPASMIENWQEGQQTGPLNADNVLVYKTADGRAGALESNSILVSFDATSRLFSLRPQVLLGSSASDTNYEIELLPEIEKADGSAAFVGAHRNGYNWSFEVGTDVDATPPSVVSVIPRSQGSYARNISIEVTFSEAMDPVVATGQYITNQDDALFDDAMPNFINMTTRANEQIVQGIYEISNVFRTVTLTTRDECGADPCGGQIFCLPGGADLSVTLKSADVNASNIPQAIFFGALPNGLTDASGNSLDGNDDGQACQGVNNVETCPAGSQDGYSWGFSTTNEINTTVPKIVSLSPDVLEDEISLTDPITATFNVTLKGSTVNTDNAQLWPRNYIGEVVDSWWFSATKDDLPDAGSRVSVAHPTLVAQEQGSEDYYPVFTHGLKSSYQICMFPGVVAGTACDNGGVNANSTYCCNNLAVGSPQACGGQLGAPQNHPISQ